MEVIAIGMEKAHGDRLDPVLVDAFLKLVAQPYAERQRDFDTAIRLHALIDFDPQPTRNHRRRILRAQIEEVVAALHSNVETVAESPRDQHRGSRALALDDGVGDERRAVNNLS